MKIPDLIGEHLNDALAVLEKDYTHIEWCISIYKAPRRNTEGEVNKANSRVVRQRLTEENKLELVVAFFRDQPSLL